MARATKQMPTSLRLSFSVRSRLSTSASTDILQSNVAPDVTSMKLSIRKPTREMLHAMTPAATAIKPSRQFHTMVKYSSCLPRCEIDWRAVVISLMLEAYQVTLLHRWIATCSPALTCASPGNVTLVRMAADEPQAGA